MVIAADMELIAHFIMGWGENVVHLNNWVFICIFFSSLKPSLLPEDSVCVPVVVVGGVVFIYWLI